MSRILKASGGAVILKRKGNRMEFLGYRRTDGSVGTRNYVGILSTVICANEVAENISRQVAAQPPFCIIKAVVRPPLTLSGLMTFWWGLVEIRILRLCCW